MLALVRALLLTATLLPLASCEWEEQICEDGEITIAYQKQTGGQCKPRTEDDPDCPDGEILRRLGDTGREDCIPNEVSHRRDGLPG